MVTGILKIHVGWEAFEGPCGRRSSKGGQHQTIMKELMFFMGVYYLLNPEKSMSLANKHIFLPHSQGSRVSCCGFLIFKKPRFSCWMHLGPAVGCLPLISTADGFEAAFQRIVFESAGQPIKCKVCVPIFIGRVLPVPGVGEIFPPSKVA